MPGLAGSDGSPLVAWPFVVKFLVPPRRPPAVCRPRCHHPLPRPPSKLRSHALGTAFFHRVLRHVPSSPAKSAVLPLFLSLFHHLSSFLPLASICSYPSLCPSPALLYISFARAFLGNLLISPVFRVFSPGQTFSRNFDRSALRNRDSLQVGPYVSRFDR